MNPTKSVIHSVPARFTPIHFLSIRYPIDSDVTACSLQSTHRTDAQAAFPFFLPPVPFESPTSSLFLHPGCLVGTMQCSRLLVCTEASPALSPPWRSVGGPIRDVIATVTEIMAREPGLGDFPTQPTTKYLRPVFLGSAEHSMLRKHGRTMSDFECCN